jgi:hypothetical protein
MSMNIYSEIGTKVIFDNPNNGYPGDQEQCRNLLLPGEVYTVRCTEVGRSSSNVYLEEYPGVRFNTCMFSDYEENHNRTRLNNIIKDLKEGYVGVRVLVGQLELLRDELFGDR